MSTLPLPRRPNARLELARLGLTWLGQLILVSLLVFATLGRSDSRRDLPLFVNTRPTHLPTETWRLARAVGQDGATAPEARAALLDLGGAALPHLLPKLDSLPPEERQGVLEALAPLAVRMQLSSTNPTVADSEALWMSFWNDHFVDFHPAMARRVVRRFVQGPTPQRALEVRRLDTFALPELLRELIALVRERADLDTIERVEDLLCSIVLDPRAPCAARGSEGRTRWQLLEPWREWWLREHHRFEAPNGAERLLAPILQTEYAVWVRTSTRAILTGRAFSDVPWRAGLLTLLQLTLATTVTWLVPRGIVPARRWLPTMALIVVTVVGLPGLLWLAWQPWATGLGFGGIGVAMGFGLGSWCSIYLRDVPDEVNAREFTYVFTSNLLGGILAVESLVGTTGLGPILVAAVRRDDLKATIGAAVTCATIFALGNALFRLLFVRAAARHARSHA